MSKMKRETWAKQNGKQNGKQNKKRTGRHAGIRREHPRYLEDGGEVSAGAGEAAELAEDVQADDGEHCQKEEEQQPDGREGRRRRQQHAHDLRQ